MGIIHDHGNQHEHGWLLILHTAVPGELSGNGGQMSWQIDSLQNTVQYSTVQTDSFQ